MSTRPVIICFSIICTIVASLPAQCLDFYLTTDVPATLGGVAVTPSDIVRSDPDQYSLAWILPPGTPVNAIYRMDGAGYLLSFAWPTALCGTTYESRDVIRYDGANCIMMLDGSAAGIPWGSAVDAVSTRGGDYGELIVSFDAPTTLGPFTFQPADLARWDGFGFTYFMDFTNTSPAVPRSSNVTGADLRGGATIITFDVPTTLGANTFQPGELVSWDGMKFTSYWSDPLWPAGARIDGLAFLADPAVVPSMRIRKSSTPGNIFIDWNPSCSNGAEDYAIYEGRLGNWYEHEAVDCHDNAPSFAEEITPNTGSHYYLVVPLNPNDEGSYGRDSDEILRPVGVSPCVDTQVISACP